MCEPFWKATLLGTAFTFSSSLTMLFIPRLGDKYGRRPTFIITRVIDSSLFAIAMLSTDYKVVFAAIFVLGALLPSRLNVGLPYLNEWFPRRHQTLI
mmetsp:Transcript_33038/g.40893  ORF Transcript_33038/g.40893 Transcript_33038/m.40893 type:complete len:97 (+) Transcript_33038:290-580(+)